MKLKTYAEIELCQKEKFYKWWYSKGKEDVVNFIEDNFIDTDDFLLELPYVIYYNYPYQDRLYMFKFMRLELWNMGINLTKDLGNVFYMAKRKKEDRYSKFLTYYKKQMCDIVEEISIIQIITGKPREEAKKIFKAAWELESPYVIEDEPIDNRKLYGKPIKKTKNNTVVNIVNTTNTKEEAKVPTYLTEVLENTLATDDSE